MLREHLSTSPLEGLGLSLQRHWNLGMGLSSLDAHESFRQRTTNSQEGGRIIIGSVVLHIPTNVGGIGGWIPFSKGLVQLERPQ
jgi:hypothetical protein